MTQDKRLTEQQRKFAELLVYNEGRLSPAEAAYQAGYKTRARQAASEMRNAKYFPLVKQEQDKQHQRCVMLNISH